MKWRNHLGYFVDEWPKNYKAMLVSQSHQVSLKGFKMAANIQYLYNFVKEFCKFDEELGFICCPLFFMWIQMNVLWMK